MLVNVGLVIISESFFEQCLLENTVSKNREWLNDTFCLKTADFIETPVELHLYSLIKVAHNMPFDKLNFEGFYIDYTKRWERENGDADFLCGARR